MKTFSIVRKTDDPIKAAPLIKASGLRKSFGRFSLHIEDLQLYDKQIYGIVGPNGCGKSTITKMLARLIKPDAGTINYGSLNMQDITLVPQKPYMMHDTVMANLTYPLKIRKVKPDKKLIDHYLELAGLQDLKQAYAPGLSSGEGQKLALIRAMVFSPKIIFVDETFSNMDNKSRTKFEKYILESQAKSPITWVIISHQFSVIERICDYVFYMDEVEA